jgi:hypothetical protein
MDDRRRVVGQFSTPEFAEQAADAVNQRDELLAALEGLLGALVFPDDTNYCPVSEVAESGAVDAARAAIARAKGTGND